jgi:hypothetical protein
MIHPRAAATSSGVEVDADIWRLRGEAGLRRNCGGKHCYKSPSVRHIATLQLR